MIIPIRRTTVKILPFVKWVAYPFFMATADIKVLIAFNNQKTGIVIILIINGLTIVIEAIKAPMPKIACVNTLITNDEKMIILSLTPKYNAEIIQKIILFSPIFNYNTMSIIFFCLFFISAYS